MCKKDNIYKVFFNLKEVSEETGIPESDILRWSKEGYIFLIHAGHETLIRAEDFYNFKNSSLYKLIEDRKKMMYFYTLEEAAISLLETVDQVQRWAKLGHICLNRVDILGKLYLVVSELEMNRFKKSAFYLRIRKSKEVFFTLEEAAAILERNIQSNKTPINENNLTKWSREGYLKLTNINKFNMISKEDLENFQKSSFFELLSR